MSLIFSQAHFSCILKLLTHADDVFSINHYAHTYMVKIQITERNSHSSVLIAGAVYSLSRTNNDLNSRLILGMFIEVYFSVLSAVCEMKRLTAKANASCHKISSLNQPQTTREVGHK